MNRTFIITVGKGKKEEDIINLAKGFATFLNDFYPEKTVFVGSKDSKRTVELIKNEFEKINGQPFPINNDSFHELKDIDDVQKIFDEIAQIIEDNDNSQIFINFTSGTKSMSLAAGLCSVIYKTTLLSLSGDRNEEGVVDNQKSTYKRNNLYRVYDKLNIEKMKKYFNIYRFEEAKEILCDIADINAKESYNLLFDYYDKWDKFNHGMKLDVINSDNFNDEYFKEQFKKNQEAIKVLKRNQDDNQDYYILADLINNSQRRFEENKYDDAVARLYRSIELIAQIKLQKTYNIDSAQIKVETLKDKVPDEYYNNLLKTSNKNGILKFPLWKNYELLSNLNDSLGKSFKENEELDEILKARNKSILAHGKKCISKEKYEDMKKNTIKLAKILNENIEEYMNQCKFPKFKLEE
ncbi:MAG: TIGR02710 family CRISPR-associated protein [Methanosphaera sp.]|nr:TIGR02710 family CRISPR-associated protein [Methanosphaera sp.]